MKQTLKTFSFIITVLMLTKAQAQWTGPMSNTLSTVNNIKITMSGNLLSVPGTTFPNIFETKLTDVPFGTTSGTVYPLSVSYSGKVGVNTNTPQASLHIGNSGNFRMTRIDASVILTVDAIGRMVLRTDGHANYTRGFFINNGTNDIFQVTPEMILFTDGINDFMKIDNNGNFYARKMIVTLTNPFPDYVFDKEYKLMPLAQLEKYIKEHKHLPNVKSAGEVIANNAQIELGEMQAVLLQKIEELTLYILQQQQQIDGLNAKLNKD